MTKKFNLINDLDGQSEKKYFQEYEVSIGFEKTTVIVPVELAEEFETVANHEKPKSVTKLKKIVESFGGEIK